MSESGEGLVDAEARIRERIEEHEQERKHRRGGIQKNPEQFRMAESLRLARAQLERQSAATVHPVRKQQIAQAIAEIEKRLSGS